MHKYHIETSKVYDNPQVTTYGRKKNAVFLLKFYFPSGHTEILYFVAQLMYRRNHEIFSSQWNLKKYDICLFQIWPSRPALVYLIIASVRPTLLLRTRKIRWNRKTKQNGTQTKNISLKPAEKLEGIADLSGQVELEGP